MNYQIIKEIIHSHKTSENITIIESLMQNFNTQMQPDNSKIIIDNIHLDEFDVCVTCNGSVDKVRNKIRDEIQKTASNYERVQLTPHSLIIMDNKLYMTYFVN